MSMSGLIEQIEKDSSDSTGETPAADLGPLGPHENVKMKKRVQTPADVEYARKRNTRNKQMRALKRSPGYVKTQEDIRKNEENILRFAFHWVFNSEEIL